MAATLSVPKIFKYFFWSTVAGIAISTFLITVIKIYEQIPLPFKYRGILEITMILLWPSSIILATPKADMFLLTISIIINAALYALIGGMFCYGIVKHRLFLTFPIFLIAFWCLIVGLWQWAMAV